METRSRILTLVFLVACGDSSSALDASFPDGHPDGQPEADAGPPSDAQTTPVFASPRGEVSIMAAQWGDDAWSPPYGLTHIWFTEVAPQLQQTEMTRVGSCRLLELRPGFCEDCNGWCAEPSECIPYPTYVSAGPVTMSSGDWQEIVNDQGGTYLQTQFDVSAIADGQTVRAESPGADLPGFALEEHFVGDIPVVDPPLVNGIDLQVRDGADLALRWTPFDPNARVWLRIAVNNHHGSGDYGVIECEGPDLGELQVPQSIIEAFPETVGGGIVSGPQPYGTGVLRRYRRVVTGDIHLVVGAQRWFGFEHKKTD